MPVANGREHRQPPQMKLSPMKSFASIYPLRDRLHIPRHSQPMIPAWKKSLSEKPGILFRVWLRVRSDRIFEDRSGTGRFAAEFPAR